MSEFENLEQQDDIRQLKWPECVQTRPEMYVGTVDSEDSSSSYNTLFREIVNNSTDEAAVNDNPKPVIILERNFNGLVLVADNGRGIKIDLDDKDGTGKVQADLSISALHTGSKFINSDSKAKKVMIATSGKNGVGSAAVNALSDDYILMSWITPQNYNKSIPAVKKLWESCGPRSKKELFYIVWYKKGVKHYEGAMKKADVEKMLFGSMPKYRELPTGMSTIVMFSPDPTIFKYKAEEAIKKGCTMGMLMDIPEEYIRYFLLSQEKFGKKKITIIVEGNILDSSSFEGFSFDFAKEIKPSDTTLNPFVDFYVTFDVEGDLAPYKNVTKGSVNGLVVNEGYHIEAVKKCFANVIKAAMKKETGIEIPDRLYTSGLRLCVVVQCMETSFGSQTKESLGGIPGVKSADLAPISQEFAKNIRNNSEYWSKHFENLVRYAESLNNLSAKAKADRMMAAGRNSGLFIPKGLELKKFANCTVRDPKLAELFLVEGDSAGAGLKSGRKIDTNIGGIRQAILALRGKILNVKESDVTRALQNKEISTIFTVLGVGIGANNCLTSEGAKTYEEEEAALDKFLRFHKIVICTDGDADGSHIQNLLLYLFSKFTPFLITHGKIYIAKAPLYYQDGNYFYPGDPLVPGTTFPVGLDFSNPQKHPYSRWKGLGSIPKEKVYDSFFNPATRKLVRVTPEGIVDAMRLIEDRNARKEFLVNRGIITNPYGV